MLLTNQNTYSSVSSSSSASSTTSSTQNDGQQSSNIIDHQLSTKNLNQAVIPTKLYVTNFPYTCTQRQISELFSRHGTISECTLKKDSYAYIQFANARSAYSAYKASTQVTNQQLRLQNRKLSVHLAISKKSQQNVQLQFDDPAKSNTKIIHVRNFPESCTQQQIFDIFCVFGEIIECQLLYDSYAFVHYKSPSEAKNALNLMNGYLFMDNKLIVQYSRSKFKQQNGVVRNNLMPANLGTIKNGDDSDEYEEENGLEENSEFSQSNHQKLSASNTISRSNKNSKINGNSQSSSATYFTNTTSSSFYNTPHYQNQNTDSNATSSYQNSSGQYQNANQYNFFSQNPQYFATTPTSSYASQSNNKMSSNRLYNSKQQSQISASINSAVDSHKTKLYVTNFPEDMDQDEMKKLFSQHGDVLECTIMWNQYAFVHFNSIEQADKAMNALKGTQYKGCKLNVQWSTSSKYQQPKQHQTKQEQAVTSQAPLKQPTKILERPHQMEGSIDAKSTDSNALNSQMKQINLQNDPSESNLKATHDKIDVKQNKPISSVQLKKPNEPVLNPLNESNTFWNGQASTQKQSWASIMNNSKPTTVKNENLGVSTAMTSALNAAATGTNPSNFKFSFSEIVRSTTATIPTAKTSVPQSSNPTTASTQKTARSASELNSPKAQAEANTTAPLNVVPSNLSETNTTFNTQINATSTTKPFTIDSLSSSAPTTETAVTLSNSNQIIDSTNILSNLVSNQTGQQFIEMDNRNLQSNASQISTNPRQSSISYQQPNFGDMFYHHQQSIQTQPGQIINQQPAQSQQSRTQQYNTNNIMNFNSIRNTQNNSIIQPTAMLSQHMQSQRNIMLPSGHVHLHNQIPSHHAPSPYQQQFIPQTNSELQHMSHHFNANLPHYANPNANTYDHQMYSQLYDTTDYGQYSGMQIYPPHSLHPQHSQVTQWSQNDQAIYATNGNQSTLQQTPGQPQDDQYAMSHLYSTIPMNYPRMQQQPQQFSNTGPTQTQQYQSTNNHINNNTTISNSQNKQQLEYKNNVIAASSSTYSNVRLLDDLNDHANNLNYSNYVLFPSENVDLQLPSQSQQQLQHQQHNYYQIEDVLANLMR